MFRNEDVKNRVINCIVNAAEGGTLIPGYLRNYATDPGGPHGGCALGQILMEFDIGVSPGWRNPPEHTCREVCSVTGLSRVELGEIMAINDRMFWPNITDDCYRVGVPMAGIVQNLVRHLQAIGVMQDDRTSGRRVVRWEIEDGLKFDSLEELAKPTFQFEPHFAPLEIFGWKHVAASATMKGGVDFASKPPPMPVKPAAKKARKKLVPA